MTADLRPRLRERALLWPMVIIAAGHAVDDLCQGAVPVLVPILLLANGWTYAMAGGIVFAATVLSCVTQPLFGLWSDRRPAPWLVPVGMLVAGIGIAVVGLLHSYPLICAAVAVSGLGVAAYHPESARLARRAARGSHTAMSWYSLSGNLGFAIAPLVVGALVAAAGVGATPWLLAPVAVAAATTIWLVPGTRTAPRRGDNTASQSSSPASDWRSFTALTLVVTLRSIVVYGMATFLALLIHGRLGSTWAGQLALTLFYGGGAVGTLTGGWLAQRGQRRTLLLRVAYLAAIPALLLTAFTSGIVVLAAIVLAGWALYIPFSLHVTLGQDYLPQHVGTASGVTLGLAVSAGGLAAPILGIVADRTSISVAIAILAACALLAFVAATSMRNPRTSSAEDDGMTSA